MQYINYSEYTSIGGICDRTVFDRHVSRACGIVDNATHNRIEDMQMVPVKVKQLCRDLIEYLETNNNVNKKNVASWSESSGPVSESISYSTISKEEMKQDIQDMLYDYLGSVTNDKGIPLLYRGCMR